MVRVYESDLNWLYSSASQNIFVSNLPNRVTLPLTLPGLKSFLELMIITAVHLHQSHLNCFGTK